MVRVAVRDGMRWSAGGIAVREGAARVGRVGSSRWEGAVLPARDASSKEPLHGGSFTAVAVSLPLRRWRGVVWYAGGGLRFALRDVDKVLC